MFPQGSLREKIKKRSASALRSGALRPIETEVEFLADSGVEFMIRVAANLNRKDNAKQQPDDSFTDGSPFLRPDPELFIADVTNTHLCVLNKYNVVDEHLLIVTREFERQQEPLNIDDFIALWKCMNEYDALAFYNSAAEAGASQTHKHLQMVPLPLSPHAAGTPVDAVLKAESENGVRSALPFRHRWAEFCEGRADVDARAAEAMHVYTRLLKSAGCDPRCPAPYNLLATNRWMWIVPRSQECFESISLNALAFAGSIFVRNRQQLEAIKANGPMAALRHVTFAR